MTVGCLIGVSYFYLLNHSLELYDEKYCAFCDTDLLNRQKFYEDDLVFALYTHKPILPGHCLIISKRQVERFEMLTEEEITQIGRLIKKVNHAAPKVFNTSSYLILQKNGVEVGQTVPHVHFHYIPRQSGNDSTLMFLAKMYITHLQKPLSASEMQNVVEKIKKAMEFIDE